MFFSGETEAGAVLAAANHFGVSPEQVVFERIEKRHGFVKRRRVLIRVDPSRIHREAPAEVADAGGRHPDAAVELVQESEARAAPAGTGAGNDRPGGNGTSAAGTGRSIQDARHVVATARGALDQLLELAGLEVSAEIAAAEERLEIDLEGVDQELLVEDDGRVLLALQHLLPRIMYGDVGRMIPCRLDSRGYQRRKEERLRGLARRVGEEVARRGGTRTLRPMNPADRRIVHLTLADDPAVETESQGKGYFKRVSVRPV